MSYKMQEAVRSLRDESVAEAPADLVLKMRQPTRGRGRGWVKGSLAAGLVLAFGIMILPQQGKARTFRDVLAVMKDQKTLISREYVSENGQLKLRETLFVAGGRLRAELANGQVLVFDGQSGFWINRSGQKTRATQRDISVHAPDYAFPKENFGDSEGKVVNPMGDSIRGAVPAKLNGRDVEAYELVASGKRRTWYIEPETGRILRADVIRTSDEAVLSRLDISYPAGISDQQFAR